MNVTSRPRRLRPHRITAISAALGLAASITVSVVTHEAFSDNGETRLNQQASQAALVLSGYLGQSLSAISGLGKAITASGANPKAFADQVHAAGLESDYYTGEALLSTDAHGQPRVIATTGHVTLNLNDPATARLAATELGHPGMHQLGLGHLGPLHTRGLLFGAPFITGGYAIYAETIVMPAFDLSSLANMPFSNVDVAVYLGQADADHAWIRTTHPVATHGLRAVVAIPTDSSGSMPAAHLTTHPLDQTYDGQLYLVMSARGGLIDGSSQLALILMVLIGCSATLACAVLLEIALRRRDEALSLVSELQAKNVELDAAMTRQAEAEEGLRRVQRMEAVGQLAGGIAHDFNNLLAVILSYAGFVAEDLAKAGTPRDDLDEITKAARRGAELTRQLLLFSRRDTAAAVPVDVNDRVHDLGRMLRRTLGEDVHIETMLGPSPLVVRVGPGELDQVIMNLAFNARDAMPGGGEITVRTARLDNGDVELTITDTGTGMTAEQVDRAFEPFYTTKEPGRGTGLGLSSVYGIVTRWDGTVEISSTKGVGTQVRVVLPSCEDAPAPIELPPAEAIAPPGTTVLLVEDEPAVLAATQRLLNHAGYGVVTAPDGPSALAVMSSAKVDVVVTDVVMPSGMSGPELIAVLREQRPGLPAVFVSGYPRDHITDRGATATDIPLVQKPYTDESLLGAIAGVLHTVEVTR